MPSTSKKQQRFFGLVKSIQEGRTKGTGQAQQAANSMSQKDVKDFASTKHDNLPEIKEERTANSPTDPSLWSKAKSKATSQFDGVFSAGANNWAAKWYRDRGGDWKTEAVKAEEKAMDKQSEFGLTDADKSQLLNYSLISALVGLGGAGAYGLVKGIHDNTALSSSRLRKYENRLRAPKSKKQDKYLPESPVLALPNQSAPSEMLSDADMNQSDLPAGTNYNLSDISGYDKSSGIASTGPVVDPSTGATVHTPIEPGAINSMLAGALTPIAALAPAAATYLIGKNLIDRYRKRQFQAELDKAKGEFESILSKSSSAIQKDVDSLLFTKTAEPDTPSSEKSVFSGPGIGYYVGLPIGVGGILGWALMNQKMKSEPQQRKLKELNNLLKRDISLDSLSSGIDLDESNEGKPTFKL